MYLIRVIPQEGSSRVNVKEEIKLFALEEKNITVRANGRGGVKVCERKACSRERVDERSIAPTTCVPVEANISVATVVEKDKQNVWPFIVGAEWSVGAVSGNGAFLSLSFQTASYVRPNETDIWWRCSDANLKTQEEQNCELHALDVSKDPPSVESTEEPFETLILSFDTFVWHCTTYDRTVPCIIHSYYRLYY